MKRFSFRLERVLRVRQLQEEIARAGLQSANAGLRDALDLEADRRTHLAARRAPVDAQTGEFLYARQLQHHAAEAVKVARDLVAMADRRVDAARDEYLDTSRRVEGLQRLRSRVREEHMRSVNSEQELLVDDIISSRHVAEGPPGRDRHFHAANKSGVTR